MINDDLTSLRERIIQNYCGVFEFKALTEQSYRYSLEYIKGFEPGQRIASIEYEGLGNFLGYQNKSIYREEMGNAYNNAMNKYLLPFMHQHTVSLFELYFFDILKILLIDQPLRLPSSKKIEFSVIINTETREEMLEELVGRELNELKYKPAADWFDYLDKLVSGSMNAVGSMNLAIIVEAKAARDLLVHSDGKINQTYLRKVGNKARGNLNDIIEIDYVSSFHTWRILLSTLVNIVDHLIEKLANPV